WVKPVGEPDAVTPHVRFDERGWETGRWPMAPSYRAHPRLYHFFPADLRGRYVADLLANADRAEPAWASLSFGNSTMPRLSATAQHEALQSSSRRPVIVCNLSFSRLQSLGSPPVLESRVSPEKAPRNAPNCGPGTLKERLAPRLSVG